MTDGVVQEDVEVIVIGRAGIPMASHSGQATAVEISNERADSANRRRLIETKDMLLSAELSNG